MLHKADDNAHWTPVPADRFTRGEDGVARISGLTALGYFALATASADGQPVDHFDPRAAARDKLRADAADDAAKAAAAAARAAKTADDKASAREEAEALAHQAKVRGALV